jgi:hemerythrin superfamily protein
LQRNDYLFIMSSGSSEKVSAVDLLVADHRQFRDLYNQAKAAKDVKERQRLANAIIDAVAPHSAAEEQILYPTIRNTAKDPAAADKSLQEHQQLKEALEGLRKTNPENADFNKFLELSEKLLFEHIQYEESQVLPELKATLKPDDLIQMGSLIQMVKKVAPKEPHPEAPLTPPLNMIAGPLAGFMDRIKEYAMGGKKSSNQVPSS